VWAGRNGSGVDLARATTIVIVLVRHGERHDAGPDPGLTAAGRRRAELLARMLADAGVTAIFTRQARRTKETAAPLAQVLHLDSRVMEDDPAAARAQVMASGQTVLVVGHTEIDDGEFDRFFVLTVAGGHTSLLSLRYESA
jgi:Histidine phosphatase superfamily (branch 1)